MSAQPLRGAVWSEVNIPQMVQFLFPWSSPVRLTLGSSNIYFFHPDPPKNYFLLHFKLEYLYV